MGATAAGCLCLYAWNRRAEVQRWKPTPIPVTPAVHRLAVRQQGLERRTGRFGQAAFVEVNMGAIVQIESSGNPSALNACGCRGLCQISKATWRECTTRMGVGWAWENDAWDPGCNRAVGNYYINTRIPQMLRHYGIDDNQTTRIGAYNWGIGKLRAAWQTHGHNWLAHAPKETQRYVIKYAEIMSRQQTKEADRGN